MHRSCRLSVLAAVAVCAISLGLIQPARASTLAGDWATVNLLCHDNAACSSYTAASPYELLLRPTFLIPLAGQSIDFGPSTNEYLPDGSSMVNSFFNSPSQIVVNLAILNSNGVTLQDFAPGGFIGLQLAFTSTQTSGPLAVTLLVDTSAGATTDGFAASDISYQPGGLVDLNFAGLAGTCDPGFPRGTGYPVGCSPVTDQATFNIPDVEPLATVPEPAPVVLVLTGLVGLIGLGLRRRSAISA